MSENLDITKSPENRPVHEVVTSLISYVHKYETIAHVLGLNNGRIIKEWVRNATQHVDPITEAKLLVAESLAAAVYDEQRPHLSGAWLISNNPFLEDYAPGELIQSLDGTESDAATMKRLNHASENWLQPSES